jgi:hypothetical protein
LVLRSARVAVVDLLALALPASAGVIAVEALVAYALHPTMRTMLCFHVALAAALSAAGLWLALRQAREAGHVQNRTARRVITLDRIAVALIVAFAVFFWPTGTRVGPDLSEGIDAWFHLGHMAKIAYAERISAGCAFLQGVGPDSRYPFSGFHFALGLLAGFAQLPLLQVWAGLARLLPVLLLPPVYFFTKHVFSHRALAASFLVLWAGTAFACEPYSAQYFPQFWRGTDPKGLAAYPYPHATCIMAMLPCAAALAAAYLRQPSRRLLVLASLMTLGAAGWHIMTLVWVPLFFASLVCLCALARARPGAALRISAACCAALLPSALLAVLAHPAEMPSVFLGQEFAHPLAGGRLFLVAPNSMLAAGALGALVAASVLLTGAGAPSTLVAAACVVFVPLVNLNPAATAALAPLTGFYMLRRLYGLVPPAFYCLAPVVAVPVVVARIYEWAAARSVAMRVCAALTGLAVFTLAFPLLDMAQRFIWFSREFPPESVVIPFVLGSLILALPIARGVFHKCIAKVRLLPRSMPANVLMMTLAGAMALVRGLGILGPEPWPEPCRDKTNALARFAVDRATGSPRFLQFIANEAAPFSTTVYCSDPFAAEITPAFAHQFTLYFDENANPRADLAARKRDHGAIGNVQVGLNETLRLLHRYRVRYIATTTDQTSAHAKFQRYPGDFPPVYQDISTAVCRVAR